MEFQTKHTLFGHYIRDASDWCTLYNASQQCDRITLSIQTKRFMHLMMALECILKAILIALSKRDESAEDAYKSARKCNHNLEELVNQCKSRSGTRYRICTKPMIERLIIIDKLGIGIRYDVDMKTALKKQSFEERLTGDGPVSGVVDSEDFHELVKQDVFYLIRLSRRISKKRLSKHSGGLVLNMAKVEDYIRKIMAKRKKT